MTKIYIDPGHGGNDPGAVGNGLQEKTVALQIGLKIRDILLDEYEGVQVRMSRETDIFRTLAWRTNDANNWDADYFVSIHLNAFNGSARGYEDFIFNGNVSQATRDRQNIMHDEIIKAVRSLGNTPNRGKKRANFHVLRETRMPAILSENLFIDNTQDAALIKRNDFVEKIARGHVEGLVKIFKLKKKPTPKPVNPPANNNDALYRVIADGKQVGAYGVNQNTANHVKRLLDQGVKEVKIERV